MDHVAGLIAYLVKRGSSKGVKGLGRFSLFLVHTCGLPIKLLLWVNDTWDICYSWFCDVLGQALCLAMGINRHFIDGVPINDTPDSPEKQEPVP